MLKEAIACYIEHRREVVLRRTRFELRKAEERAELLEGYLIALGNLDEFIRIIRDSANRDEARINLLAFEFDRAARSSNFGILIRNESRLDRERPLRVDRAAGRRNPRSAPLPAHRPGERQDQGRIPTSLLETIKDLLDILAREARVMTSSRTSCRPSRRSTPRRA